MHCWEPPSTHVAGVLTAPMTSYMDRALPALHRIGQPGDCNTRAYEGGLLLNAYLG